MDKRFKPKASRFGVEPSIVAGKQLDAGITASATVNIPIPTPYRKCFIERVAVSYETAPIGGGAITGILQKRSGGSNTAMNSAFTLTGLTVQTENNITILGTLTDAQRILQEGDYLFFAVTAASTVTTQPVGMTITVELLVLE